MDIVFINVANCLASWLATVRVLIFEGLNFRGYHYWNYFVGIYFRGSFEKFVGTNFRGLHQTTKI